VVLLAKALRSMASSWSAMPLSGKQLVCNALSRQLVCSALIYAGSWSAMLPAKASSWSARPVNDDCLFLILVFVGTEPLRAFI